MFSWTLRGSKLLRMREGPRRANFLELFFDLVFVVALFQLSHELMRHLTWRGAFQTLLLLLALWWTWAITVWTANLYEPRQPTIQGLVIVTMLASLVMVVAVPDAFGARGLPFAGGYIVLHIGRQIFLVFALRGHMLQRRSVRALFWFCVSAVPWIAGAFAAGTARELLWTAALAVDMIGGLLRFPTPKLGRSPESEYPILAEHLTERYQQLFVIALGELILVTALTLGDTGFTADRTVAFVVSFAGTVLFWRIYVHRAAELLTDAIARAPDSDGLARWAGFAHLVMIAGIVTTAVGDELFITHSFDRSQPAWIVVILGGPALFLAGRAGFEYVVFARVSWDRPIGILVLVALAPLLLRTPPLLVAIAAMAVLGGVAVTDAALDRRRPHEQPSPPGRMTGPVA